MYSTTRLTCIYIIYIYTTAPAELTFRASHTEEAYLHFFCMHDHSIAFTFAKRELHSQHMTLSAPTQNRKANFSILCTIQTNALNLFLFINIHNPSISFFFLFPFLVLFRSKTYKIWELSCLKPLNIVCSYLARLQCQGFQVFE